MGLLLRAAGLVAFFAVLHAFGLREYATILCGSSPTGSRVDTLAVALAAAYIFSWFALVLGTPILVLGAGFSLLLLKLQPRKPQPPEPLPPA
jgi:hypothetical protein